MAKLKSGRARCAPIDWILVIAGLVGGTACQSEWERLSRMPTFDDDDAREALYECQRYAIRFGSISVAEPVAVKAEPFAFNLGMTAKELYAAIAQSIQVAGRFGNFTVTDVNAALRLTAPTIPAHTVNPVGQKLAIDIAQAVLKKSQENMSPENLAALTQMFTTLMSGGLPTTLPAFGLPDYSTAIGGLAPQPTSMPEVKALPAPELGANPAAARLKELGDQAGINAPFSQGPTKRVSESISGSADAFEQQQVLQVLSRLAEFRSNKNLHVQPFVTVISVAPGSVTSSGFVAEAAIRMKVYRREAGPARDSAAGSSRRVYLKQVNIIGLHPTGIGQGMDLENFFALQNNLMLKLIAEGYVASAAGQAAISQLQQAHARTINQRILVSSFQRASVGEVGFHIRGEYWSTDPMKFGKEGHTIKPGQAVLLQDVSVPVVCFAILDRQVLDPHFSRAAHPESPRPFVKPTSGFSIPTPVLEKPPSTSDAPRLEIDISTTWVPEAEADFPSRLRFLRPVSRYPELEPQQSYYRSRVADLLYNWKSRRTNDLRGIAESGDDSQSFAYGYFAAGPEQAIASVVATATLDQELPIPPEAEDPKEPSVTECFPAEVPADRASFIVIRGGSFTDSMKVTAAGLAADLVGTFDKGRVALVRVDPTMSGLKPRAVIGELRVVTDGGSNGTPIKFSVPEPQDNAMPNRSVIRYRGPDSQPYTIETESTSGAETSRAAYKAISRVAHSQPSH